MRFQLITDYPVAIDSPDHIEPRGTMRDNSVNLKFNYKLFELCPGQVMSVLDLGCAGGGMVKSFVDEGHIAVGLEGSDYNLVHQRAAWATIPDNLFTCDVSQPFTLHLGDCKPYQFDVVTAWEFLEHIRETDLSQLMLNIRKHLADGGLVIGSISDFDSIWKVIDHHQTKRPMRWWRDLFYIFGFSGRGDLEEHFAESWVRKVRYNFVVEKGEIGSA